MPHQSQRVKQKPSTRRKQSHDSPAPEPTAIWCAMEYANIQDGYLVTEPGNVHRPVAFIDIINGSAAQGFEVAQRIRDYFPTEPWRAVNEIEGIGVIDLTPYGQPGSAAAMPGFVYGLRCIPVNEDGEDQDAPYIEPRPWCRFMAAEIAERNPASSESPTPIAIRGSDLNVDEYRQLFALRRLHYFVNRFYGYEHPVAKTIALALTQAFHPKTHAHFTDAIRQAEECFKSLNANEQRAIFNGWKPLRLTEPLPKFSEILDHLKMVPVVDFDALTSNGTIITTDIVSWFHGNAVTLRVKEGSTLPQIIDALEELQRVVPVWFHRAISGEEIEGPIEIPDSKRGTEMDL